LSFTGSRSLAPGDTIGGYRIDAVVGRGGMGVVYRATQLALGQSYALKVIAPEYANNVEFRERFKRESRTAAAIQHPNVLPIYYAGEENGVLFIAMLYVTGTDLRELIDRYGALNPAFAAGIVAQVAAGLDAAHRHGLVHRDVKPANILIHDQDGASHAYLTDFGLTKQTTSTADLTRTGRFVGTVDYSAPEQLQGRSIDARADIYSLGCVLYHALTGQIPFPRDSEVAKVWAHVNEEPPSLARVAPRLPSACDELVRRAMAKDPVARYPSAGEFGRAALAAVGDQPTDAGERPAAARQAAPDVVRPKRRGRLIGMVAGIVLAAVVAVVAILLLSGGGGLTVVGSPVPLSSKALYTASAAGDGAVWVPNGDATLTRIDSLSGKATTVNLGQDAVTTYVVVGEGAVWVDTFTSAITAFNPANNGMTTINVPADPKGHILDVGGGSAWVLGISDHKLTRINARTDKVITTVDAGKNVQSGAWCGADFCLTYTDGTVRYLDLSSNTFIGTSTPVGQIGSSAGLAGAAWYDAGILFVGLNSTQIARLDVASAVVASKLNVGTSTSFFPDNGSLWVADPFGHRLERFDETTGQPIGSPLQLNGKPEAVVAKGRDVWVVVASSSGVNSMVHVRA
jgi:hypothetical protein